MEEITEMTASVWFHFVCADSERAKSRREPSVELEKEEAERLPLVSMASVMGCTYRRITSYPRVCDSPSVEDRSEMSYYCESCEEYLGSVSGWAERHRSLGHAVLAFT